MKIKAGYRTGSGNTMVLDVTGTLLPRDQIPLIDQRDYMDLCQGCKGLNGGCSYWAPYFEYIKPSQKKFYVVDVKLDMAWAVKYAYRHSNSTIKHNYFRCGYADLLTDHYTWGLIKRMEQETGAYALGIGHCHGCRSKKMCTILQGEKTCISPEKRHYSIEATGVECSALNEQLHGERLPWWFKGPELPLYMRRFAGLFVNHEFDNLLHKLVTSHRSYIPFEQAADLPEYEIAEVLAPADSMDAGTLFPMYVDFGDGLVAQEAR